MNDDDDFQPYTILRRENLIIPGQMNGYKAQKRSCIPLIMQLCQISEHQKHFPYSEVVVLLNVL